MAVVHELEYKIRLQQIRYQTVSHYLAREKEISGVKDNLDLIESQREILISEMGKAEAERQRVDDILKGMHPPGFFERIFLRSASKKKEKIIFEWEKERRSLHKKLKNLLKDIAALDSDMERIKSELMAFENLKENFEKINRSHPEAVSYLKSPFHGQKFQTSIPFNCPEINDLRSRLFGLSIRLHQAWLSASRRKLLTLSFKLKKAKTDSEYRNTPVGTEAFRQAFLFFPVMSTTFASVSRFLGGLSDLGWLFVDEAGQALPQQAVGAMMRFQKSVVVGDPLQLEPIRAIPEKIHDQIYHCFSKYTDLSGFNCFHHSVQSVADTSHENCGMISDTRVGSPLRVHRRCSDPMFSIANEIAYDSMMIFGKSEKHSSGPVPSRWINVSGQASGNRCHWVENQGAVVTRLMTQLCLGNLNPQKSIYIITPFKECDYYLKRLFTQSWIKKSIGTVHTFQGKEADIVILVLGLDHRRQGAAEKIVGHKPNLLNVAVTRAKSTLIVIGDVSLWGDVFSFEVAKNRLDVIDECSEVKPVEPEKKHDMSGEPLLNHRILLQNNRSVRPEFTD